VKRIHAATPSRTKVRRSPWQLIKCAASRWASDEAATIGAALAFYSAFSLAPLLVILVTVAGWIVGAEVAYGHLSTQLTALFGATTAKTLLDAMRTSQSGDGIVATTISVFSLILGATTVLVALESALERIWGTTALAPTGLRGWLRSRLLSFGLILAVGFLLLVSLSITTMLVALRNAIARRFAELVVITGVLDFVISTALTTAVIALIYRYMPAKRLPWRQVSVGALITALLFFLGRWAIGLYLGRSTQPSAFGAAASFVALLLWLYYSAQIFLFGAEFTACFAGVRAEAHEPARLRKAAISKVVGEA
jgi:membrane protein